MTGHQLTYIDMYPAPVSREPSGFVIWGSAALIMLALCAVTAVLFSL
jgi:hypothetical protein